MSTSPKPARRRVYAREIKARTGWGDTWLRMQEQRGRIPPSHRDEGGKRKFWFDDESDMIVEGATKKAKAAA